jgi:hypothetical protein
MRHACSRSPCSTCSWFAPCRTPDRRVINLTFEHLDHAVDQARRRFDCRPSPSTEWTLRATMTSSTKRSHRRGLGVDDVPVTAQVRDTTRLGGGGLMLARGRPNVLRTQIQQDPTVGLVAYRITIQMPECAEAHTTAVGGTPFVDVKAACVTVWFLLGCCFVLGQRIEGLITAKSCVFERHAGFPESTHVSARTVERQSGFHIIPSFVLGQRGGACVCSFLVPVMFSHSLDSRDPSPTSGGRPSEV